MNAVNCQEEEVRNRESVFHQTETMLMRLGFDREGKQVYSSWYAGLYVQVDLIQGEGRMVITLAQAMKLDGLQRQYRQLNYLNLQCSFGSHMMDISLGCYYFRASVWLDRSLTSASFYELLDQFVAQARKGVQRLKNFPQTEMGPCQSGRTGI